MPTLETSTPKISVVLPTYNQASYLPQAIESVFWQTNQDFELIVVNDGSTDDTVRILDEYQERNNFMVIHQNNQKLPHALNRGFQRARGEYLTLTSSDNVMLPTMLEDLAGTLDRYPDVGLVYADWQVLDENNEVIGQVHTFEFDRHLLMRVNYINACFMYRKSCQEKVGVYDPQYIHAEDWEYWWRISKYFLMMRVPRILYQYRVHGSSLTQIKVISDARGISEGYQKLSAEFHSHPLIWYFSKLKWEFLRFRLGQDPQGYIQYGTNR